MTQEFPKELSHSVADFIELIHKSVEADPENRQHTEYSKDTYMKLLHIEYLTIKCCVDKNVVAITPSEFVQWCEDKEIPKENYILEEEDLVPDNAIEISPILVQ